jgi:predicted nucleic acid-binding protein
VLVLQSRHSVEQPGLFRHEAAEELLRLFRREMDEKEVLEFLDETRWLEIGRLPVLEQYVRKSTQPREHPLELGVVVAYRLGDE